MLNPQVIGQSFPHGFAGCYARQPDMVHATRKSGEASSNIPVGLGVVYSSGNVVLPTSTTVAANFVGVAAAEVKTNLNYNTMAGMVYAPGEIVDVFKRGHINVKCQNGTPALNGTVYLRVAANASYPNAVVGGFEASADSTNSVALTNAKWVGGADADGIAELNIMYEINA